MQNRISFFLFILFSFFLLACNEHSQDANKREKDIPAELNTKNNISSPIKSSLRPNEKMDLEKVHRDTVKYLAFNQDYDDWLFVVEKNKDTIALVYNKEEEIKFSKGDEIVINWKMDSLRYAGDAEILHFTEYLISAQKPNATRSSETVNPELYFTIATSGLIVRKEPGIASKRIGKIPYGSIVELLEETDLKLQITDNGLPVDGFWVKIKFNNYPYKIIESDEYKFTGEGYVFSEFIEKLEKASIVTSELDSIKFNALYKSSLTAKLVKVTSQKEIEHLLGSKVKWKNSEIVDRYVIDEIRLNDQQTLRFIPDDLGLIAYYPSEEVLLFEEGHGGEFTISLKTGESLETVGNPEQIVASPTKKFRLNGWYSGQECSHYFFQKKSGDHYLYLVDFGWGSEKYGESICYFNKFCWLNDGEFLYAFIDHSSGKAKESYYRGQIKLE